MPQDTDSGASATLSSEQPNFEYPAVSHLLFIMFSEISVFFFSEMGRRVALTLEERVDDHALEVAALFRKRQLEA